MLASLILNSNELLMVMYNMHHVIHSLIFTKIIIIVVINFNKLIIQNISCNAFKPTHLTQSLQKLVES